MKRYHDVDSSALAFEIAAKSCFRDGMAETAADHFPAQVRDLLASAGDADWRREYAGLVPAI